MFIRVRTSKGDVAVSVDHITHIIEDPNPKNQGNEVNGSCLHLSTKEVAIWTSMTVNDILDAIEQVYAAERVAYTMLVDEDEGWPVYNGLTAVPPKDRN